MTDEQPAANDGGEFEREPVPASRLLGFGSFIGMYAGEHCAGTELMIGPLFVAAGVSAFDLVAGLFIGNLLAVLSWTFMTAPIATRARLTLYYQLEKIAGRKLVTLYSLANGAMFCILAGSMITVSATAVGVWFDLPMPTLNDKYPNGAGWVIAVAVVGMAFTIVAAIGYEALARFANLAAPWMLAVFAAFGLIGLKQFIDATGSEINSLSDLWTLCNTAIWKGGEPLAGQTKFTFWHVMFFAWFCNMAMHIGMSDLSVLRFAKKPWYGIASASGMYLGHFMAWIAASILYALQMHVDPGNTDVSPGPMTARACGVAGLICVIVAGWTTANPTIYRAGLAFQAVAPTMSRFKVTMATGLLATIAGMFPVVAMKLLGFVALYGLLLMPIGAVVFVDFWLMPKLGMRDRYADRTGSDFNWAAALAWVLTFVICGGIAYVRPDLLYFVSLPGWFLAAAVYLAASRVMQAGAASVPVHGASK
jgi:purine-cytosine permease-like protein